ncbi:MAG: CapA family protein [Erysipelotrichaceae bacterium]|nr:CapA family protein [Erysipelotrichaceae bacterium]
MKYFKLLLALVLLTGCFATPSSDDEQADASSQNENIVSFVAVGDNLIHQRLIDEAETEDGYDFSDYYTNISSYIAEADLAFVNQETVLAGGTPSGYPNFNTPDEMAQNLSDLGFDIVNGATNHSLDKGLDGILHSISVFEEYDNLTYIGLYESQEDRDNIRVVESNGITIAFLSYNQMNNGNSMPNDYCLNLFDEDTITEDVNKAKELADFVVVSAHWGNEYDIVPDEFQTKYAELFASLDVDVVLGTHSHTLQDVQWLDGNDGHQTLVAYSLGNFISGMMSEDTQLGGMLSFDLIKEDDTCYIDKVSLTPLVNHYEASDSNNVYDTRCNFTVYRLKDYTDELALKHGLNGYDNITISISDFQEMVNEAITSDINIDM